jgi:hypothetical protein
MEAQYHQVLVQDLLGSGCLDYLWSPYKQRPCFIAKAMIAKLAPSAPVTTDAILAFNNANLAKQLSSWLVEGSRNHYPVRSVPLLQLEPTLRRWRADGYHYLDFPTMAFQTHTFLGVDELLTLIYDALQKHREIPDGQHQTGSQDE